jgi:ribosomal protein S18 acetylase RimI-like enzyme
MVDQVATPPWLSAIEYRHLVRKDLPALEWGGEYIHFRRMHNEVYRSASQGKALIWVAMLPESGLVGQLFVSLHSARAELADGVTRAYLYGFRVKPVFRHYGVGTGMLHAVEAELEQRKFGWITLNVGRDNPDARCFYERHGYRVVAAEPGSWFYIDHRGRRREVHEPAWRMEKRVASRGI